MTDIDPQVRAQAILDELAAGAAACEPPSRNNLLAHRLDLHEELATLTLDITAELKADTIGAFDGALAALLAVTNRLESHEARLARLEEHA